MKPVRDWSGLAALEMALLAPFLLTLAIASVDFGAALLAQARIARALESAAEYATMAGQNGVSTATISTNAQTIAKAVSNGFLSSPTATAVVSGTTTNMCCLNVTPWSCSNAPTTSCSDGSTPGVYIAITAQYTFTPLFSGDAFLTSRTIGGSIVAPLQ